MRLRDCGISCKAVLTWLRSSLHAQLLTLGILFYIYYSVLGLVDLRMALFFLAGVALRRTSIHISQFFHPTIRG